MKTEISNVHVDHVSHNHTTAAAGFNAGEFRYHVWFNPVTLEASGPLYKNPIDDAAATRQRTVRLNPAALTNRAMLDDMWKQIRDRDLIRIALQNDEIKRAAEERAEEATRRRRELCTHAIYEVGAVIDGKPCAVLCDEASARIVLPNFQGIADDCNTVYCRDLVNGSTVACFLPLVELEVAP